MNVNEKGSLGLLKLITDIYSKGFTCFIPFDDYNPVDCIALTTEGKTIRLQVKYRSPDKNDAYEIAARSVVNGKRVFINKDLIDFWAVYLADLDRVVYIPMSIMDHKGSHKITRKQLSEIDGRLKSMPG